MPRLAFRHADKSQVSRRHAQWSPGFKGFAIKALDAWPHRPIITGGAHVLEILVDDSAGTYRAVYTIKFQDVVFVLHVFQKKSKQGISTPKKELELIEVRLKMAEKIYKEINNNE